MNDSDDHSKVDGLMKTFRLRGLVINMKTGHFNPTPDDGRTHQVLLVVHRDAAIEPLDFAIAEFQDMKMQPALERALGRRGLLKAES